MDILGILVILCFFAFIWFLPTLNVMFSRKTNRSEKLAWLLIVIFTSWLGWIFYLFLAPVEKLSNANSTSIKTPLNKIFEIIFISIFAFFMFYNFLICYLMMGTLLLFFGIYSISSLLQIDKNEIENEDEIVSYESDEEIFEIPVLQGNYKLLALIILIITGLVLSSYSILVLWHHSGKFN